MQARRASPPLRQAFALAHAMQARPTPELATCYFNALLRVLETNTNEQGKEPGNVPGGGKDRG